MDSPGRTRYFDFVWYLDRRRSSYAFPVETSCLLSRLNSRLIVFASMMYGVVFMM